MTSGLKPVAQEFDPRHWVHFRVACKKVDAGYVVLGPSVDCHMGLGDHDHAAQPMWSKLVKH
jgi:hypothetical protein